MRNFNIKSMKIMLMLLCFSMNVSYASQTEEAVSNLQGRQGVYDTLYHIMQIMVTAGIFLAVGKMMHIGIKYMTSPASGKSSAREALLPWFIGLVLLILFGSIAPWIISYLEPEQKDIFSI